MWPEKLPTAEGFRKVSFSTTFCKYYVKLTFSKIQLTVEINASISCFLCDLFKRSQVATAAFFLFGVYLRKRIAANVIFSPWKCSVLKVSEKWSCYPTALEAREERNMVLLELLGLFCDPVLTMCTSLSHK